MISITGAEELKRNFNMMREEFGAQRTGRGLVTAVRRSLKPALSTAKSLVPVDTGALRQLLRIEARLPSRKDKRSIYVKEDDVVIGLITTPPAKKLEGKAKRGYKVKLANKQVIIPSDARAIAQEFGTSRHPAQPFLRPSLESQAGSILSLMGKELNFVLQKYRKNT